MIIHDVIQGSEAWHQLRLGRFTGSTAANTMLTKGKNADEIGEGLFTLLYQKVAETVTGESQESFQGNAHTERGTALEPYAVTHYEEQFYQSVTRVGFVQSSEYIGCSPDGFVGADGMIEIKCPSGTEFVRYVAQLVDNKLPVDAVPKQYMAQMQWQMWVCGRAWCDFVVYNPDFAPLEMIVCRVYPDKAAWSVFEKKAKWVSAQMVVLLDTIAQKRGDA